MSFAPLEKLSEASIAYRVGEAVTVTSAVLFAAGVALRMQKLTRLGMVGMGTGIGVAGADWLENQIDGRAIISFDEHEGSFPRPIC